MIRITVQNELHRSCCVNWIYKLDVKAVIFIVLSCELKMRPTWGAILVTKNEILKWRSMVGLSASFYESWMKWRAFVKIRGKPSIQAIFLKWQLAAHRLISVKSLKLSIKSSARYCARTLILAFKRFGPTRFIGFLVGVRRVLSGMEFAIEPEV